MEIELWSGNTKAIIDPRGAWLTNLSDDRGDILFPKRSLKNSEGITKLRGGCHVCVPNFGPGGESGQPQHGFGREMNWTIQERTESTVALVLEHGSKGYESLRSVLRYSLGNSMVAMTLELINNGEGAVRVAPAFHPYFAIIGGTTVLLDGEKMLLEDLSETRFISGGTQELTLPNRRLILRSKHLSVWAQWTDQLGPYVCVEPTVGGYAFLNAKPGNEEILRPGNSKEYSLEVEWR